MSILQVLLIAFGLAMDAFAVSIAEGMGLRNVTKSDTLRVAIHFGGFQAVMPVVGWLAANSVYSFIAAFDHWVAFGLLTLVGAKMLADSLFGFTTGKARNPSTGARLLGLSVATSIDAFAVGVSLAMLQVDVWLPAAVFGIVTGVLCAIGVQAGDRIGSRLGRWAEFCGGLVLCAIGVKILCDHLL